ncbi:MAG: DUF4276 family protein [Cytophagales bacterium]|nr:MAG: DUF4276 family protein [Cytophagales bacterium]
MARIEILTEEQSMCDVLKIILPKILPEKWILEQNYFIRPHNGKSDLQRSIPKKIKVFSNYHEPAGVVIVHDQDSHDCKELKNKLLALCKTNVEEPCPILIRIACRELEAWYLGDMHAIQSAYPKFKAEKYAKKKTFRNPDNLNNATEELEKILPDFQKGASARAIAPYLDTNIENNESESYRQFINGIVAFFQKFEKPYAIIS